MKNNVQEIIEANGRSATLTAYYVTKTATVVVIVGNILTLGLLSLILYWLPYLRLLFTSKKCSLSETRKVHVKDCYDHHYFYDVIVQTFILNSGCCTEYELIKNYFEARNVASEREQGLYIMKHFTHKKEIYIMNDKTRLFEKLKYLDESSLSQLTKSTPLTDNEVMWRQKIYGTNTTELQSPSFLKLLFKECISLLYVFQIFGCILWYFNEYMIYATCILVVGFISLFFEVYHIHKNKKSLRKRFNNVTTACVRRRYWEDDNYIEKSTVQLSADLVPGDVIDVPKEGCMLGQDAVLLSGSCIVDESMLTGESTPIRKTSLPKYADDDTMFEDEKYSQHILYSGTRVIQAQSLDNDRIMAVVIRTGFSTSRGKILCSILYSVPRQFKFQQDIYKTLAALGILTLIGMSISLKLMTDAKVGTSKIILRCLDLITIGVPPQLKFVMISNLIHAIRRLQSKHIYCINPNRMNTWGGVQVQCFDKTGTLSESDVSVVGVVPVKDMQLTELLTNVSEIKDMNLLRCLGTCHSLAKHHDELLGDPIDKSMLQFTEWELIDHQHGDVEEDLIVPYIVRLPNGALPLSGDICQSRLLQPFPEEVAILKQFVFISQVKCLSVITRKLGEKQFVVYTKGAPEKIEQICKPASIPDKLHEVVRNYHMEGDRVLAMAYKSIHLSYTQMLRQPRDVVESDLTFIGLVVFQNKMKPETKPTIDRLKNADIRVVMVSGDDLYNCLSMGYSCNMIPGPNKTLIVEASPPNTLDKDDLQNISPNVRFQFAKDVKENTFDNAEKDGEVIIHNSCTTGRGKFPQNLPDEDFIINNDLSLAVTGDAWKIINEHYPHYKSLLTITGTVFARFTPEQKVELVNAIQCHGYVVSMCGDGANDCGALKAAHTAVSLSDSEASVASPFTSKTRHIGCVIDLIREGRCSLVSAFGAFKFILACSLIQFLSVILLYYTGSNLGDWHYLFIDLFLVLTLGWSFSRAAPFTHLSRRRPETSLASVHNFISIGSQLAICFSFQIFCYFFARRQPWYLLLPAISEDYEVFNVECTVLFIISSYQYIIVAIVFSIGPPFRQNLYKNYWFFLNLVICVAMTVAVNITPNILTDYLELYRLPSTRYTLLLSGISLINFCFSYHVAVILDTKCGRKVVSSLAELICRNNKQKGTKSSNCHEGSSANHATKH